jgi:hypothetical protein
VREAFAKMLRDERFVSDYKKTGRSYEPKTWKEVNEIVEEVLTMDAKTKMALEEALKRREGP